MHLAQTAIQGTNRFFLSDLWIQHPSAVTSEGLCALIPFIRTKVEILKNAVFLAFLPDPNFPVALEDFSGENPQTLRTDGLGLSQLLHCHQFTTKRGNF